MKWSCFISSKNANFRVVTSQFAYKLGKHALSEVQEAARCGLLMPRVVNMSNC